VHRASGLDNTMILTRI